MYIKIYRSFGSQKNAFVHGHVFQTEPMQFLKKKTWFWTNINALIKIFSLEPVSHVPLTVELWGQHYETLSNDKGYFEFRGDFEKEIPVGWHPIKVYHTHHPNMASDGEIYIAQTTSQGIITDIDDTLLKSYSASFLRKIYELLFRNPHERRLFNHIVEWYRALAQPSDMGKEYHPFFYVSSSEWNLYDYLTTVFNHHQLPKGIFLLSPLKSLKNIWQTGKTEHEGKGDRIRYLIETFPQQKFILIGDNTQKDPYIYTQIAQEYPQHIKAIFIRNKKTKNKTKTLQTLNAIQGYSIETFLFDNTLEAIDKSKELGYIQ